MMQASDLFFSIKNFDQQKLKLISEELNINTINDFLEYFPYKYVSQIKIENTSDLNDKLLDNVIEIEGSIDEFYFIDTKSGKQHLEADFVNENKQKIKLIWFRKILEVQNWLKKNQKYILHGELKKFKNEYCIIHPNISKRKTCINKLIPYYITTNILKKRGVDSRFLRKIFDFILKNTNIEENLPVEIINKYKLLSHSKAIKDIHQPFDNDSLFSAKRRLKFEELFFLQLKIFQTRYKKFEDKNGYVFNNIDYVNRFKAILFPKIEFTNAQKRVLNEIYSDLRNGKRMNRLLQGDVGSGKTIVAFTTMLMAISNNYQAVLMTPTEILSEQHFITLQEWCKELEINIALLTSSTKQKDRKEIIEKLKNGDINIIVGTQSLLNESIIFKKLGLIIIDEQHKFGVIQRAKISDNYESYSNIQPHVLIMTATPIPRTLAMTIYNDYDISIIDELPKERKPIKTIHFYYFQVLRMVKFVKEQIDLGHQVYVVYPLIEESEKLNLKNVQDGYNAIVSYFPGVAVSIIHGQMDFKTKNIEFEKFKKGQTKILVATTVIEVGIDVPNATVIVIAEADHFGLSQLHQLRGRVGRGNAESFCILLTKKELSENSRKRIKAMLEYNDGFKLSNIDLQIRGFGDMFGIEQSGNIKLKIADFFNDAKMLECAINEVKNIIKNDPSLEKNIFLKQKMIEKNKNNFGNIG